MNEQSDIFDEEMQELFDDRYAYVWITNNTTYNVGLVNPTSKDTRSVEQRARKYGATGAVVPAKFSAHYLDSLSAGLDDTIADHPHVISSIGVNPTVNKIEVRLRERDSRVMAEIQTLVPPEALLVVDETRAELEFLSER